jgi:predicted metal-dependent hydrolase
VLAIIKDMVELHSLSVKLLWHTSDVRLRAMTASGLHTKTLGSVRHAHSKNTAEPTETGTVLVGTQTLSYVVVRRPGRSFSLRVTTEGQLKFCAPARVALTTLLQFAARRQRFVANRLAELAARANTQRKHNQLEEQGQWCPLPASWWRKAGQALLPPKVHAWAQKVGVTVQDIRITRGTTVWGTCAHDGRMTLSYRLLQIPPELCEYVIVHEVCHRREMNHSARFWRLVGQFVPDYVVKRRALNRLGATLT